MTRPKPVVLCILDGWGHRDEAQHNAIASAHTPHWDALWQDHPHSFLATSGLDVGLPEGQMGNSEVGHMTIGSGRIVMQSLPRIDRSIAEGELPTLPAWKDFLAALKQSGGTCHLMGLVSDGGVHAHIDHIIALAKAAAAEGVPVAVHAFTDGRDTPPESGKGFVEALHTALSTVPNAQIATVSGRYYAMDRDNRWERVEKAYAAIVQAEGPVAENAATAVQEGYDKDQSDEFITPMVLEGYAGMQEGDGVLMANFRADRVRQILTALLDSEFTGFARVAVINFAAALGMAEYSDALTPLIPPLFPPENLENILGEVVADAGLTQLRIAETEKYAHVTFFLNGGREGEFPGEERILVPSPSVATYDLQPEMAAPEVTEKLVDAIAQDKFDLIVVNYANTDMVGHTGDEQAAIKAVEAVDSALGTLYAAVQEKGGALLVTADHGNAELMVDPDTHVPHTAHTTFVVPCILAGGDVNALKEGRLCDIAPTILALLGLPQPAAMTGNALIDKA